MFDISRHRIRSGLNRKGLVNYKFVTLTVGLKRPHSDPLAGDV
jgi:hypothetical protein